MPLSRSPFGLLVPAGVVGGHALVHTLAHGWQYERQLLVSGHGPLRLLAAAALPLAVLGLLSATAGRHAATRARIVGLVSSQMLIFALVVVGERGAEQGTVAALVHDPLVWAGVAAQLLTGLLLSGLVSLAGHIGECLRVGVPLCWGPVSRLPAVPQSVVLPTAGPSLRQDAQRAPPGLLAG